MTTDTPARLAQAEEEAPTPAGVYLEEVAVKRARFLRIHFPYSEAAVDRVRSVPGRKWDRTNRVWTVPARYRAEAEVAVSDIEDLVAGRPLRSVAKAEAENAARSKRLDRMKELRGEAAAIMRRVIAEGEPADYLTSRDLAQARVIFTVDLRGPGGRTAGEPSETEIVDDDLYVADSRGQTRRLRDSETAARLVEIGVDLKVLKAEHDGITVRREAVHPLTSHLWAPDPRKETPAEREERERQAESQRLSSKPAAELTDEDVDVAVALVARDPRTRRVARVPVETADGRNNLLDVEITDTLEGDLVGRFSVGRVLNTMRGTKPANQSRGQGCD